MSLIVDVKLLNVTLPLIDVPEDETTNLCITVDVPEGTHRDFHIIATSPKIDNIDLVHHAKIFGCPGEGQFFFCFFLAIQKNDQPFPFWIH